MKTLVAFILIITFSGCTAVLPTDSGHTGSGTTNPSAPRTEPNTAKSPGPVKSPHGYIITKDYEPGRFGGFRGDCADDQNWPYYWECQSENAGNGGFQ